MTTDSIDWFSSIRGRVGFAQGNGLMYFTGGVAVEGLKQDSFINAETAPSVFGVSAVNNSLSVKGGYVFGAGYEWMIARNWSLRGEYLFYEFMPLNTSVLPFSLSAVPGSAAVVRTHDNNINLLRVGLTYRF